MTMGVAIHGRRSGRKRNKERQATEWSRSQPYSCQLPPTPAYLRFSNNGSCSKTPNEGNEEETTIQSSYAAGVHGEIRRIGGAAEVG